jgi:hypothetical protein
MITEGGIMKARSASRTVILFENATLTLGYITKHLFPETLGNSEFCVTPLHTVVNNSISGSQNSLFPSVSVNK